MPVDLFTDGIEPEDSNTPIWRFLEFWKFQDLMTGHMYFRRSDSWEPSVAASQSIGLGTTAPFSRTGRICSFRPAMLLVHAE